MGWDEAVRFEFQPNDRGNPPGKVADVDVVFLQPPFVGLKLVGFAIWEDRKTRNVTFPARQYTINGESRSFKLLRGVDNADQVKGLQVAILKAWDVFMARCEAVR